jgi:hypothetical protein
MVKTELFEKMEELLEGVSKETLLQMMFDCYPTSDLESLYIHIKEELEYE